MKKRSLEKLSIRKVNISSLDIRKGGLANNTHFVEACNQNSTHCHTNLSLCNACKIK
ncbi:hypothetical protein [Kordia sp.]|uniref:hypothetical protein n=1 Tax=Kordia sp. TaxID=1965332 RepID=UPI003D6A7768